MRSVIRTLALIALAGQLAAQVVPALPYSRTLDLLVVDTAYDGVWRLADLNQDGDYQDPGETVSFYSDVIGSIPLTNPCCIVAAPDGTVYVGDSSLRIVIALRDQDGDGDANDPGEHRVFFDSVSNASGVVMASVQGITVDALGRLFLAVANTGTLGTDTILRLHDLDADGDANDLAEASVYCAIPGGSGAVGNSIPTKVVVAPDASVYYTDVASAGAVVKGIYKLTDLDSNGDCNGPGEHTLFWAHQPAPQPSSPFYWTLAVDWQGNFWVTDHSANQQVWRLRDVDASGTISAAEQQLYYQSTGSTWWDVVLRDDGAVLLCDAGSPDRVTALRDLNQDGDANDPGESSNAYTASGAPVAVAPRGATLLRAPRLELAPPTVAIGNSTTVAVAATKPGDLTLLVLSVGLAPTPFPLAPWGTVEVDASAFASVALGFADPAGNFAVPFAVPNTATAIGTWAFQALSGDGFRLFLSNASVMTVTP
jgi:hypothetical protein